MRDIVQSTLRPNESKWSLYVLETDLQKSAQGVSNIIEKTSYAESDIERWKQYAIDDFRKIFSDPSTNNQIISIIFGNHELRSQIFLNKLSKEEKEKILHDFYVDILVIVNKLNIRDVDGYLKKNPGISLHIFEFNDILKKVYAEETLSLLKKYKVIFNHQEIPNFFTDEQKKLYENYLNWIKPSVEGYKKIIKWKQWSRILDLDIEELGNLIESFDASIRDVLLSWNQINSYQIVNEKLQKQVRDLEIDEDDVTKRKNFKWRFRKVCIIYFWDSFWPNKYFQYLIPNSKISDSILIKLKDFIEKYQYIFNNWILKIKWSSPKYHLSVEKWYYDLIKMLQNISFIESRMNIDILE